MAPVVTHYLSQHRFRTPSQHEEFTISLSTIGNCSPFLNAIVQLGSLLAEFIPFNVKRFLGLGVRSYLLLVDWPGHKNVYDLFPAQDANSGAFYPVPILGIVACWHDGNTSIIKIVSLVGLIDNIGNAFLGLLKLFKSLF